MSQVPRRVDPFEDRERAVALAQRQQPSAREPERATDERPVRSAVRDDGDRPTRVCGGDRFERGPRTGPEGPDALAGRERKPAHARHPPGELPGPALLYLRAGRPFPRPPPPPPERPPHGALH